MKNNKLVKISLPVKAIILAVCLLLPLISIYFSKYEAMDGNRYALGLPFRFLSYYGENLPAHKYELFTWDVFTQHVTFNVPLYFLNAFLVFLIILVVILLVVRTKNTKRTTSAK
ncbi:hypothetical protein [Paenibacillus daejeonensis]|uniref:hypothetical protein n=1 Tax=Paenibacillus daejeonensis TaxID=135193 RepID=UPI0012FC6831|nr:hypothetical protein [Paenibacillus daejeonensis]